MEIKQYVQENEKRFLDELFSLIRIPSISALPEHKKDMLACAERWRQLLLEAGADKAMIMPSEATRWYMPKNALTLRLLQCLFMHIMT